jgi:hypothetical protein
MIDPFRVLESESWRFCCRFRDRVFILELCSTLGRYHSIFDHVRNLLRFSTFQRQRWCHGGGLCVQNLTLVQIKTSFFWNLIGR